MPLALSTGHTVGLAVVAGAFILFALTASFLLPRYQPDFPGRALPAFVIVSVLFFFGMMTAVEVFGAEGKESEHAGTAEAPGNEVTGNTAATTNAGTPQKTIVVTGTEYKLALKAKKLAPGAYVFRFVNAGKQPHNLTVSGPQVNNEATPTIGGGKSAALDVALVPGTYDLYCSVPGHKELGMDVSLTVGSS